MPSRPDPCEPRRGAPRRHALTAALATALLLLTAACGTGGDAPEVASSPSPADAPAGAASPADAAGAASPADAAGAAEPTESSPGGTPDDADWPTYPGSVPLYDQVLEGLGAAEGALAVATSADAPEEVAQWYIDRLPDLEAETREDGTVVFRRDLAGGGQRGLAIQPIGIARLPAEHPAPAGAATAISMSSLDLPDGDA